MTDFTPFLSLFGGGLIGLACLILLLFNGRIAGISGIFSQLLASDPQRNWRWLFILGLVLGPLISASLIAPSISIESSWFIITLSGFFVGFGAKLGSGCTSGHGICGMGRLATRSIVATCLFMTSAIFTVFVIKHLI